jgi:prepilin-type N-terminal cleavage/methylation domain-containing protein
MAIKETRSVIGLRSAAIRPLSGFTLIEILVVIAVILLLLALLLPSLNATRERARRAVCLSNLRESDIALKGYAQDYQDRYPSQRSAWTGNPTTTDQSWPSALVGWEGDVLLGNYIGGATLAHSTNAPPRGVSRSSGVPISAGRVGTA